METNYRNSETPEDTTDYFLGIINNYPNFNVSDTEDKLLTLERILKEEGAEKELIKKLDNAKNILSKLSNYYSDCQEYHEYFHQLRDSLAEIHEARLNKYNGDI